MGLKSLFQFNKDRYESLRKQGLETNGIACPRCGLEMIDGYTWHIKGKPTKVEVICVACGKMGERIE